MILHYILPSPKKAKVNSWNKFVVIIALARECVIGVFHEKVGIDHHQKPTEVCVLENRDFPPIEVDKK